MSQKKEMVIRFTAEGENLTISADDMENPIPPEIMIQAMAKAIMDFSEYCYSTRKADSDELLN